MPDNMEPSLKLKIDSLLVRSSLNGGEVEGVLMLFCNAGWSTPREGDIIRGYDGVFVLFRLDSWTGGSVHFTA